MRRAQERGGNPDRGLLIAFGRVGRLCTALGLVKSIQDRACEVYKEISESKSIRGRGLAAVCAAVVYIACRCATRVCLVCVAPQLNTVATQGTCSAPVFGSEWRRGQEQAGEQPADGQGELRSGEQRAQEGHRALLQIFTWRCVDRLGAMRRQENNPRTFKEICAVASNAPKHIGRCS